MLLLLAAAIGTSWVEDLGGRVETNARKEPVAVHLRGTHVADADLTHIAAMPQLERLDLSLTRVTDLGLLRLKDLKNVREINLFFAELVTDEGLAAMRNWPRIQRLNLRGTKVTDNTLALLAGKESIAALDIGYAEVTDSGLQNLPRYPNLRELAFGGNKMTEVGLQVLRSMPQITHLDISGKQRTDSGLWFVGLTDIGLDPVATLAALRVLNVSGTPVSARGVEKLKGLNQLERLNLLSCRRINDDVVTHLAAMPALKWVELKDTGVTAKGFAALRAARPNLQVAGDPSKEPPDPYKIETEEGGFRVTRINTMAPERNDAMGVVSVNLQDGSVAVGATLDTNPHVRVEVRGLEISEQKQLVSAKGDQVLLDTAKLRISRLACPSRASCPDNQAQAVDVQLGSGAITALRAGSPPRYNEAPLPLELIRIEVK
ncbi:MAG: hypothetical protein FJW39_22725 [Acidobacteria bacterium]|nr:hypothetical protein [Acidobacteriota bacterium]